jgi:two-component system response regulator
MNTPLDILLVEDDPQDAELAIHALKTCHLAHHLVHVRDGQEALDFLFGTGAHEGRDVHCRPKVVMLDLKLPKVNGIEVLRQIRAHTRTKLLPVTVFTSSREESDLSETYRLGVNSYIVKPVDFESFSEVVGHLGQYWLKLNEVASGE